MDVMDVLKMSADIIKDNGLREEDLRHRYGYVPAQYRNIHRAIYLHHETLKNAVMKSL